MGLLGRRRPSTEDAEAVDVVEPAVESPESRQITAPKGRPTPKRDAAKRRGPVAPAPMTSAEARRRRKEIGGRKLSREERREARTEQRQRMADRRERMMAGEEGYLLPRDQGPVRRYVRDLVDARRGLLGLFMPISLGMVFLMLAIPSPRLSAMMSIAMMVLVLIMLADAFILGRKVNRRVDQKYPNHTESGWRLGFYAASRASQIRRIRAPRPQVKRGDAVT